MSSSAQPFGTFFLPGPTEVHPVVLQAMTRPMIAHRGKEFESLFARLQTGMRDVFRTTRPILISSSSATGLMEAAVRCAPPGPVLAVVNGAFSERFAHIARSCERDTDVLDVPLGRAVDLDELRRRVKAKRYAAVTLVHSETSTGALSDAREATRICREAGALCLVDSVTGVAGVPLLFDAWDMDFALTGSQKALALPPGLALGVASGEYMRTAPSAKGRGLYFDLVEFESYAAKNQTPNTPALPLFYALDAQLARVAAEGMEARWARHRAMAEQTWEWVADAARRTGLPLKVLSPEGERSLTVTAIRLPAGITGPQMAAAVRERGFVIGSGYGKLRETTFRIGHMGDHTPDRLALCLTACEEALVALTK
ncbi:MAG TPA: alanine--glyoxylate aminotransferase family protein [Gemmatimonadaceae bacterium]